LRRSSSRLFCTDGAIEAIVVGREDTGVTTATAGRAEAAIVSTWPLASVASIFSTAGFADATGCGLNVPVGVAGIVVRGSSSICTAPFIGLFV
jgi:hypothetical protein